MSCSPVLQNGRIIDEEEMHLERTLNFSAKFYGEKWENAKEIEILMW